MLKERVLQITKEMVGIYSPTNTAEEQKVEVYLLNLLQSMPYFKEHPENYGAFACADDCFERSTIYGLVLGKSKKTVVFMGHHDVVSTEVYVKLLQPMWTHCLRNYKALNSMKKLLQIWRAVIGCGDVVLAI